MKKFFFAAVTIVATITTMFSVIAVTVTAPAAAGGFDDNKHKTPAVFVYLYGHRGCLRLYILLEKLGYFLFDFWKVCYACSQFFVSRNVI